MEWPCYQDLSWTQKLPTNCTQDSTLPIRMKAHSSAASTFVNIMPTRRDIPGIIYPGDHSYKQFNFSNKMKNDSYGNGGMITLDCGSLERATKLRDLQENKFGLICRLLGFSRTLLVVPLQVLAVRYQKKSKRE